MSCAPAFGLVFVNYFFSSIRTETAAFFLITTVTSETQFLFTAIWRITQHYIWHSIARRRSRNSIKNNSWRGTAMNCCQRERKECVTKLAANAPWSQKVTEYTTGKSSRLPLTENSLWLIRAMPEALVRDRISLFSLSLNKVSRFLLNHCHQIVPDNVRRQTNIKL